MDSEDTELNYETSYFLPVLYGIDKRGKERMWKIWVVGNTVHRSSGLIDGKKVPWKRSFTGKNKGKINETSDEEQAKLEADRSWTKQLEKEYKPKCKEGLKMFEKVMKEKNKSGGINRTASEKIRSTVSTKNTTTKSKNLTVPNVETDIIPMKAQEWKLSDSNDPKSVLPRISKHFDFEKGVYCQWKLDGFRCTARIQSDGKVVLTSNSNKQYPWFKNLRKEVFEFLDGQNYLDGLDCEVYSHRLEDPETGVGLDDNQRFSTIQSICGMSRTEPHLWEDQICLYVFDLVDISGKYNQDERFKLLEKLFERKQKHIIYTETILIHSYEDVVYWHGKFAEKGYEGIILRDRSLVYKTKARSLKMRKFKHFIDKEYPIVDISLDKGVDPEHFVWVCEAENSKGKIKKFKAKPRGTWEQKRIWYENYTDHIGKLLTVKFQEYSEDGIPRFPIAYRFREEGDI
jgi:hypothetical protein